jgi:mycothiol synthase
MVANALRQPCAGHSRESRAVIVLPADIAGGVDLSPLGARSLRIQAARRDGDKQVWLALEEGRAWGCARVMPVPGLPAVRDLELFVAPERRRQGVGSLLWQHTLQELAAEPRVCRVSAAVRARRTPLAHFLTHHGFYLEHVEWEMSRPLSDELPEPSWPAGYRLTTFRRAVAIRHFLALYGASFSQTPWYQPFSRDEVEETLQGPADLLFASTAGEAVAVAWLRVTGQSGRIEPIGVVEAHQGKGVGRALLEAALSVLRQRGVTTVRLGVWKRNRTAIHLYRKLGFRRRRRTFFLAYDLI